MFSVQSEKMTKKRPRFGAIPVLNMPRKSHETNKPPARVGRSVVQDAAVKQSTSCYKTFSEFCERAKNLKTIRQWEMKSLPDRMVFKKVTQPFLLPEIEIIVDDSLGFTIKVFGSYLVEDHQLYNQYRRSMRNVTLSTLVKNLNDYKVCAGVDVYELSGKLYHHVVPISHDSMVDEDEQQFPHKGFWRTKECALLHEQDICSDCSDYMIIANDTKKLKENKPLKPAHIKAPISKTDPERVKLTLQGQRLRCGELERELNEMRAELLSFLKEIKY